MTKWARIDNQRVVEVTDIDPAGRFHPSFVWVSCAEEVTSGYAYDGSTFTAPPPPPPTTAQDLAPGRSLAGLTAEEIAAFEELATLLNENPEALKVNTEATNG